MLQQHNGGYRLGAPFGIPLYVNKMLFFFVGIFAVYGFATRNPLQAIWPFFIYLSVYLHELGHALAATRLGGRAERIMLHIFGGATFTKGVRGTRNHVILSAAGPAVNLVIGAALLILISHEVFHEGLPQQLSGALAFANILWGVFNLLPIFPLDGGMILLALLSRRRPPAQAEVISGVVSLAAIVMTALVAARTLPIIFLFVILGLLGWMNVQRIQRARAVGGRPSASPFGPQPATSGPSDNGRGPHDTARASGPDDMRSLATDSDLMRALLRHCRDHGLGDLSPDDRRLIMFHRHLLEEELARRGFEALDATKRELLALHHDIDDHQPTH